MIKMHVSPGFGVSASQPNVSRGCWIRCWPQFREQLPDVGKQISREDSLGHLVAANFEKAARVFQVWHAPAL
jgi:hypothetical protein